MLGHGDETEIVALTGGRMCIDPRDVWHRFLVKEPGKLLFATPSPSTEYRGVRQHKAARSKA